jgi:hypothetical protein
MCMEHQFMCKCGKRNASFNFKNEIMPAEIISALYCPECSDSIEHDPETMLTDNGWVIEYDMDIARLYGPKMTDEERENNSPELLFDRGYATWRGVYPGDHLDSVTERQGLLELSKVDPRGYIEQVKEWSIKRMDKLRKEGWRKAYERETV